jgi:hypothetical protein
MKQQTISTILDLDGAAVRCQAAQAQHSIANQDALAFAERIGELLLMAINDKDMRMGQNALLLIKMRRTDEMVTR